MNKQYDWNLENPREFIQSQLVTFAISGQRKQTYREIVVYFKQTYPFTNFPRLVDVSC